MVAHGSAGIFPWIGHGDTPENLRVLPPLRFVTRTHQDSSRTRRGRRACENSFPRRAHRVLRWRVRAVRPCGTSLDPLRQEALLTVRDPSGRNRHASPGCVRRRFGRLVDEASGGRPPIRPVYRRHSGRDTRRRVGASFRLGTRCATLSPGPRLPMDREESHPLVWGRRSVPLADKGVAPEISSLEPGERLARPNVDPKACGRKARQETSLPSACRPWLDLEHASLGLREIGLDLIVTSPSSITLGS